LTKLPRESVVWIERDTSPGGKSLKRISFPKGGRLFVQGLPLAGAAGTALLPASRPGQQFVMLIVLIWIQIFFIMECFLCRRDDFEWMKKQCASWWWTMNVPSAAF
jgi:hypothetical protein